LPPPTQPSGANLLPTLSLPKGGGALRGIGEKLTTNAATGTGSFTVPIATSPGRAGFELALQLDYDSGAGNGPFGLGWKLSTPSITRKTDKGLPRYADADSADIFVLSGAEDLVPVRVADGAGTRLDVVDRGEFRVQRFRPRVEGLFARIERWTNHATGDAHWRSISRDNCSASTADRPARIADPEHAEHVFSWLLEETRDDRGNVVCYRYKAGTLRASIQRRKRGQSLRPATGRFAPVRHDCTALPETHPVRQPYPGRARPGRAGERHGLVVRGRGRLR